MMSLIVVGSRGLASRLAVALVALVGGSGASWVAAGHSAQGATLPTLARPTFAAQPAAAPPSGRLVPSSARSGRIVIVQTNAAGDNVHLIDPETNRVIGEITGIEVNHGAAAAPDGRRLYITNEADHTLDIVDGRTLQVTTRVRLSGRPNNLAISKDGRRLYVAIVSGSGAVDVVDAASERLVKTIPAHGGVHNTFLTPDGRFVVAGSIVGRNLTVIDAATEQPLWSLHFDNGVRPIAFETNPDGSTRRLFVQISNDHGFRIVDFAERREVGRVRLPDLPLGEQHHDMLQGSPSHGIGVAPDGKTLWVCSKVNSHVYVYALPDLTLLGGVKVGDHPDWLTFTPDSKRVFVANAGSNSVSVIDVATRTEIARIPVGQVPKRNITAVLP
jgi:YVTN family beta-propeller protein